MSLLLLQYGYAPCGGGGKKSAEESISERIRKDDEDILEIIIQAVINELD